MGNHYRILCYGITRSNFNKIMLSAVAKIGQDRGQVKEGEVSRQLEKSRQERKKQKSDLDQLGIK